ncbi:SDR family NAD(P)-dependent oxidoreductase [Arhodomonas aquaeolei]|uniref:SDR family NAD(P)-dependent oxidoreductase n=1 Tax=Arhodomonas aquaeolei TaxID=2369 RepID=UPI00037EEAA2|nr:SDR family NAD(P)-dependent oxidoreductase [Arhodomonas aquaeolei]
MTALPVQPLPIPDGPAALSGHRVLITGAGNGLGRAMALAAASAGATVVLLERTVKAAEAVYDEIVAAGGPEPAIYPMELAGVGPDDLAELAERLREGLGGLDALVLNAAEIGQPAPLTQYEPQVWLRTLHVNVNAAFLLLAHCAPLLLESAAGRVLFISDEAGREGVPFMGAYGVSKWALEGLMHTYAAELPDDTPLRLASVDPGPVRTLLRRTAFSAETEGATPLPEAVAPGIVELLDPATPLEQAARFTAMSAADEEE